MIILISFLACVATLIGGFVAVRLKDKLHLILGFSAGAVVAVAFFDLMPESITLGSQFYSLTTMITTVALGFFLYLILDRVVFLHAHAHDDDHDHEAHEHNDPATNEAKKMRRGILGAGSLSVHSFLDGVAIGLAFQVSDSVGAIVAIAVLVHDFSDGVNTVSMILKNRGSSVRAFRWLAVDALAPVLGAASTLFFTLPEQGLSIILAIFSGFFLYIGASDLVPESQHNHPKLLTTVMTLLGAGVLYLAIHLASI
jgi:ZIP family zinc transporter